MSYDELKELIPTLPELYKKHNKKPDRGAHIASDCGCCALELIAMDRGLKHWTLVVDKAVDFVNGFDGKEYSGGVNKEARKLYDLGIETAKLLGLS